MKTSDLLSIMIVTPPRVEVPKGCTVSRMFIWLPSAMAGKIHAIHPEDLYQAEVEGSDDLLVDCMCERVRIDVSDILEGLCTGRAASNNFLQASAQSYISSVRLEGHMNVVNSPSVHPGNTKLCKDCFMESAEYVGAIVVRRGTATAKVEDLTEELIDEFNSIGSSLG